MNKAQVADVFIGLINIKGLMLEDGSFAVGVPQICEQFNIPQKNAVRDFKALLGDSSSIFKVKIENTRVTMYAILLNDFEVVLLNLVNSGNKKGIELWNKAYPEKQIFLKENKKTSKKQGYIYLFESSSILKLGYSTNVEQRLKTLSRWEGELEIVAVVEGSINKEKSLHSLLHSTGDYFGDEWYPTYRKHEILRLMDVKDQNKKFVGWVMA